MSTGLITTVGILLAIAGLAMLLDPVLVAIVVGGLALLLAIFARARRTRAPMRTEAIVVAAALITAGSVAVDGLSEATLLLALGFVVLAIGSWDFDRTDGYSAASSHQ